MCLNLRLLSFNVPECRLLRAYFNVVTPASLILELFVPVRFGMTGRKTVIIRVHSRITALYPPTLALTARSRGPFHLGNNQSLRYLGTARFVKLLYVGSPFKLVVHQRSSGSYYQQ